jgi:hypothetical protein
MSPRPGNGRIIGESGGWQIYVSLNENEESASASVA